MNAKPTPSRFALATLASLGLLACAGHFPPATAATHAEVTLRNRSTGAAVPLYRHNGQLWAEGRPGERYAIELRNLTGGRILTTVSVDGVNVLSGETAATSQSGYVLDPWARAEVAGWRKSMQEVAAFYFSSLPDSYAARTGRPDHVGVIGVAVFAEFEPPRPVLQVPAAPQASGLAERELQRDSAAASTSAEQKSARSERIGTGHGERIDAPTQYTSFRRASNQPVEVLTIRYDTRANLIARGVIRAPRPQPTPQPFPAGGFVPDPA